MEPDERVAAGAPQGEGLTGRRVLLGVAFFLSGFSGLTYEIVWIRALVHVFGVTYYAIATIVTSFMAGMAIGAMIAGRISDRRVPLLKIYAVLELVIALFALALPLLIRWVTGFYPLIHNTLEPSFFSFSLVRFCLCSALLIVPTTAMGATLPILARALVRDRRRLGGDIGRLYGINTLGAALGCLLTGCVLASALGNRATSYIAVGLNLAAACIALVLDASSRADRAGRPGPAQPAPAPGTTSMPAALMLAVFFLAGFSSMAYELLWTRAFTMVHTNPQTDVFYLVLFLYLLGMGLGSALYGLLERRPRHRPLTLFASIQVTAGLITLAALHVLLLFRLGAGAGDDGPSPLGDWLFSIFGVYFGFFEVCLMLWVILLPGILSGMVFPISARLYIRELPALGSGVGAVYFVLTVGGIVGSFAAGFYLMPALSLKNSLLLMAALNFSIAAAVGMTASRGSRWTRRRVAWCAGVLVLLLLSLDSARAIPEHIFVPTRPGQRVLFYADGRNVSSAVVDTGRRGERLLFTSGEWVAGWPGGVDIPITLHRGPESLLTISFGAGGAPNAAMGYPCLSRITSVDLDDNQRLTARLMVPHAMLRSPRFRLEANDGRNFVFTTSERYDLIFNDPGTYTLYRELGTREFLKLCKDRLREGGLLFQKAHADILTWEGFRREVATLLDVFPELSLWHAERGVLLLVAGSGQGRPSLQEIGARMRRLLPSGGPPPSPMDFAAGFLLSTEALRALSRGARPFSDDRIPGMEQLFILGNITVAGSKEEALRHSNLRAFIERIQRLMTGQPELFRSMDAGARRAVERRRRERLREALMP